VKDEILVLLASEALKYLLLIVPYANFALHLLQNPPLETDDGMVSSVPESSKFASWFPDEGIALCFLVSSLYQRIPL
jgi:hypothetical protein